MQNKLQIMEFLERKKRIEKFSNNYFSHELSHSQGFPTTDCYTNIAYVIQDEYLTNNQTWAHEQLWLATTCLGHQGHILNFYKIKDLWTRAISQKHAPFGGQK